MHLSLHLTTACNLRCSYCYLPPRWSEPMSVAVASRALDLAWRLHPGAISLDLTGGEPLLYLARVREILMRAREMEAQGGPVVRVRLLTNGLLLDDAFHAWLMEQGVQVGLSFHGVQMAQDAHRRLPDGGSTWSVAHWRSRALLHRDKGASVHITLTPQTVGTLSEAVGALLRIGARRLVVTPDFSAPWPTAEVELRRELKRTAQLYLDWAVAGDPFSFSMFERYLWGSDFEQPLVRYGQPKRRLALDSLAVDGSGYVYANAVFIREGPRSRYCLGDVFRGLSERLQRALGAEAQALEDAGWADRGAARWLETGRWGAAGPNETSLSGALQPVVDRLETAFLELGLPRQCVAHEEQLALPPPY